MVPRWSTMPPSNWTSKWRWPSARLAASRTVANASTSRSSSAAPSASRCRNDAARAAGCTAAGKDLGMPLKFGNPAGAGRWTRRVAVAGVLVLGAAAASAQTVGDALKAPAGKDDPIVARVNAVVIHRSDVLHAL